MTEDTEGTKQHPPTRVHTHACGSIQGGTRKVHLQLFKKWLGVYKKNRTVTSSLFRFRLEESKYSQLSSRSKLKISLHACLPSDVGRCQILGDLRIMLT